MPTAIDGWKVCSKCGEKKEATNENFPHDKKRKDGLSSWCRLCHSKASRSWENDNKEHKRNNRYKWQKSVYSGEMGEQPLLKQKVSRLIKSSIRDGGFSKTSRTHQLLGCSYEALMEYLGPQPSSDHQIDHICPCSQAQNEEELLKLQHYTNLRWLHRDDNLSKSDKWTEEGAAMCLSILGREWTR